MKAYLLILLSCLIVSARGEAVYHFSSHPGAYHKAVAISSFAETVTHQDGSLWAISYTDRYKVIGWLPTDILVIVPVHSWFSSYDYNIVNEHTGDTIDAHLISPPTPGGKYTYQITEIDYENSIVEFEDSIWALSFDDETMIKKWRVKDLVIIGINDGWNASIRPNILINVRLQKYATANCITFK